jgi:hypothetical protein
MSRCKVLLLVLGLVVLAASAVAEDEHAERGKLLFKSLAATPVDTHGLRSALRDIGHVELTYRKGPLTAWREGATVTDGQIYLTTMVALNRTARGDAPDEWIDKLTAPLAEGYKPSLLRLAVAPADDARAHRDRIIAEADGRLRAGLLDLAKKYPVLAKTNWGTLEEALSGTSPKGTLMIWAGHYSGSPDGLKAEVPEKERFNILISLEPIHWPSDGHWAMNQVYPNLALMGQVLASARESEADAAVKALVAEVLGPLQTLNDKGVAALATSAPTTASAPTSRP